MSIVQDGGILGGAYSVDTEDFYFNKSDLVVNIEPRERSPLHVDDELRLPPYMHTCIEELSRDLCVYYMAPKAPDVLPVEKYVKDEPNTCFPMNEEAIGVTIDQLKAQHPKEQLVPLKDVPLLQHYHPEYRNPISTFKRSPSEKLRKILEEEPFNYNLMLNLGPVVQPEKGQKIPMFKSRIKFEPIFGAVTIYAVVPSRRSFESEDMVRVSETFHFDATDQMFKEKYPEVYQGGRPDVGLPVPPSTPDVALNLSACILFIPVEFQRSDLFLVVQLSKVLTGDGDKAVAPYLRSSGIPEPVRHEDACRRLHQFRQPLAISIWKLFDDAGNLVPNPKSGLADMLSLPFYCLRSCINDATLKQYIREFYPKDGSPKSRLDVIDMEMNLSFFDLGCNDEIIERLPPMLKQNYDFDAKSSPDSKHLKAPSFVSESSKDGPIEGLGNPSSPLYFVPSQFHEPADGSGDKTLAEVVNRMKAAATLPRSICYPDVLPVRKLMSLDSVREYEDDFEPLHSSIDHTLFLYPTALEKFHHRNLCLRVMLVEVSEAPSGVDPSMLQNLPHTVLKHIYSTIPGRMFTDFAQTQVTYHSKNPIMNDEIKIRLPLAPTQNHYLLFEMHHVHVKPKNETRRSSISSMLGFKDQSEDTLSMKIGQAFHPLLSLDKANRVYCLPPNGDYSVLVFDKQDGDDDVRESISRKRGSATFEPGVIKFSIISKSSFVSTSPELQLFLSGQQRLFNCYGGVMPSSLIPYHESKHHVPKVKKKGNPSATGLSDLNFCRNVTALLGAPRRELKQHFQLIMRQLLNTMCSGGMVYTPNFFIEDYASPLNHPPARCWSFLAMLHLFHRIEPEGSNYSSDDASGRKNSMISAYVDFLFDEEVLWNAAGAAGSRVGHDSTADTKNMINVINELRQRCAEQSDETPAKKAEGKYLHMVEEHCTTQVENVELNLLLEDAMNTICRELSAIMENGDLVTPEMICAHAISVNDAPCLDISNERRQLHVNRVRSPTIPLADAVNGKNYSMLGCDPFWEASFKFEEEEIDENALREKWFPAGVIKALRPRGLSEPDYFVDNVKYDRSMSQLRERTPSFLFESDWVTGYRTSNDHDHHSNGAALNMLLETGSETSEAIHDDVSAGAPSPVLNVERSFETNLHESVDVESVHESLTPRDAPHTLQPILPFPSILEGADDRRKHRRETTKKVSLDIKSLGMPVHHSSYPQQWWPYMYEVITQQWFCMLTALTQKTASATRETIPEEGSEDDDSDDNTSDVGGYDHQGQYAFTRENIPALGTVPPGSSPDDMTRWIALDQGPVLLKIIMKSIALRVSRAGLNLPVMFDDGYLTLLEKLVVLITKETMALNKGINRHSKLNSALASFLKELLGVVALVQVAQLVQSYFKTVRAELGHSSSNVNIPDLRLKFLGTIASFDDFVGINIPLVLESISETDSHELVRSSTRSAHSRLDSGSTLRWMQHPRSYWLSHLVIEEVMYIYRYEINNAFAEAHGRQDVQGFRKRSLRFICDLLVRVCYDPRYQSPTSRRRIGIMFCPILREIASVVDRLEGLPHDATERKEFLVIFLYLLQNFPENLLRAEWRHFLSIKDLSKKLESSRRNTDAPPPVLAAVSRSSSSSSKCGLFNLPITKILLLMHLCLDTFEFPMRKGNAEGNPSIVLAPVLANDVDNVTGPNNNSFVPKKGAEGTVDKISRLENIRQSRAKGRPVDLRRKSASQASLGNEQDAPSRSWKKHLTQVKAIVTVGAENGHSFGQAAPSTLMRAAKYMSHDVAMILFTSLEQILQEFEVPKANDSDAAELQCFSDALEVAVSVCLHGLLSSHSVDVYRKIFRVSKYVISKFGARFGIAAIGSTMQDWMSITFKYCNSFHIELREAACSFFLHILMSVSREYGSLSAIYGPLYTMFGDVVISEISKGDSKVSINEKKSGAFNAACSTAALKLSMTHIADVLSTMCGKAGCSAMLEVNGLYRIKNVVTSLLTMLQAYCLLNNYFTDFANSKKDSVGTSRGDLEYTIELCYETSEFFDPILLPTFRIRWLLYIARLHVMQSSMAEHAECLTRMCSVYEQCAGHWEQQWVPRPLIVWSQTETDETSVREGTPKNFLKTLRKTLSQERVLPWESQSAFREGMISVLQLAMNNYFRSRFFFLAEKTSLRLLAIHRAHGEFDAMRKVYEKQAEILSNSLSFSAGNYFRVLFAGSELPAYLADKEFIYRNADLLHVSEFQNMLKNHLRDILPGLCCSVIPDSYYLPDAAKVAAIPDTPAATGSDETAPPGNSTVFIIMAAVKPFQYPLTVEAAGSWSDQDRRVSRNGRDGYDFDALSRVGQFQYSVPFTKVEGKAYAKTIDKQWKRTTYLTVKHPFPFVNIRAPVVKREMRELCPIESGIIDIEDVIQQMREKLSVPVLSRETTDISDLKRFVQGTVVAQVFDSVNIRSIPDVMCVR